MSIVKDLLLILLFFLLLCNYFRAQRKLLAERNYFINTLNHDLRVSAIAQIRGLELLKNNIQEENSKILLDDINNSCKFSLEMITMLLNSYQTLSNDKFLNYETIDLNSFMQHIYNDIINFAYKKDIIVNFIFEKDFNVYADKIRLKKVLEILILTCIFNAEKKSEINVLIKKDFNNFIFKIVYTGQALTEEEFNRTFLKNTRFSTVGHGIKMHFCKKMIDFHKGKFNIKTFSNNINSFTFTIPKKKESKRFERCLSMPFAFNKLFSVIFLFVNKLFFYRAEH